MQYYWAINHLMKANYFRTNTVITLRDHVYIQSSPN